MIEPTTGVDRRSFTPLIVGIVVLSILVALLATRRAAVMVSLGDWGGAVGAMIGPFVSYAAIELLLTWAARRVFGQSGSRFATSRLNYLALALTVVPVLGSLTRPIA